MTDRVLVRPTKLMGILLLIMLLALSGCGGGAETPEPEIAPTPTLIPTLEAPAGVEAPAEPTATEEPADEDSHAEEDDGEEADHADEEATDEEATEEAATDEEMTEAEAEGEAAEATEAEEVTEEEATEDTTDAEAEAEAATEEVAETEEVTASEEVTTTDEMTATEEITATEVMTDDHAMTEEGDEEEAETAAAETESDASVFFLQPTANANVPLTFTLVMSYTGVTLAPAADGVEGAGHLHVLVDTDFVEAGEAVPSDAQHLHFGNGATTAELSLTPGSHTLRLQFADNSHIALEGDQYRHEIVVNAVEGAEAEAVRIVSPSNGATVPPTFTVTMAATGVSVEPAGIVSEGAGHFHLLVDEPFVPAGEIIPADETHLHFGQGQLSTELTLEPGTYLIRLQLADGLHTALAGDQYRAEVQVIVEEGAPAEQVMFIKPRDGATVTSPFLVGWAASGLIIEPAGGVMRPESGHLHVLIDEEFVAAGEVVPADETHLHFGKGQTSTELTLEPGEHTLRLQMANGAHAAQDGEQYQDELTVTVR